MSRSSATLWAVSLAFMAVGRPASAQSLPVADLAIAAAPAGLIVMAPGGRRTVVLTITNLGPAAAAEPIIFGAPLLAEFGLLSVQAGAPGLCPVVIDHLDPPPGNPPHYFLTAYPGRIEPGQSRECALVLGLPLQSNQPWSLQFLVTGGNDPNPANDGVTIELAPQVASPIPGWSTAASIASALALILAGGSRLRRYPRPEHALRLG